MKAVFFSPLAYLWPHALAEFQLAQLLQDEGCEVKVVGCRKSYASFCTSMDVAGLDLDADLGARSKICGDCIANRDRLTNGFAGLSVTTADQYGDESIAADLEIIPPQSVEEIANCIIDGIEVGKLALYETLIKFKKFNMDLTPYERRYFEAFFRNSIKVIRQATNIIRDERPDVLVCYSPQYVYTGVFAAVAARDNVRTVFIEGSSNDNERYSHLRMWDWHTHGLSQPAMKAQERFEAFQMNAEREARARKLVSLREAAKAFSTYTSAAKSASPYDVFGLDRNKKYLLIAMSSYDEVYSGYMIDKLPLARFESSVFKSQIEWLQETIAWAKTQPDLQFVVRPHPREFPNKREGISSPHEKEWSSVLSSLPDNVKVDHPNLKFSLYDHLSHVDVVVTGWSSTGVEALSKGVPVVSYDEELPTFPRSIHYTGKSKSEYFANILRACQDTDREKNVRNALRWLAYTSEVGTVRIGGRFQDRFPILAKIRARRVLGERMSMNVDTMFKPSKRDVSRILRMIRGEATSLFHLPEQESA